MALDPQQEYAEALEDYRRAMIRIMEAKKHIPPSKRDLYRQRLREERAARIAAENTAEGIASRERIDAEVRRLTLEYLKGRLMSDIKRENDGHPGDAIRVVMRPTGD